MKINLLHFDRLLDFSAEEDWQCVVGRIKKGTSCVILHSIARIVEAMRKLGNWRPVVDC